MIGRLPKIALVCAVSSWAAQADACTPSIQTGFWFDKPIHIAKDGSFKNAEQQRYEASLGNAVKDISNGKIAQRLIRSYACGTDERLLVVDCQNAQMIVIDGRPTPNVEPEIFRTSLVENLYPPNGKVRLTKSVTVDSLVKLSKAEGYSYQNDVEVAFGGGKKKNRYNPFNGCKLFYPDSAGAKQ